MSIYKGTELLVGIATNTIENAHSLLDYKWTDHILNELSWLRADTFSWQSGEVYVAVYNHLVADYSGGTSTTETVGSYTITYVLADDGHKITTDETNVLNIYNESGVSWYYILDTANQRFKLPRTKYGFTGLRDSVGKYVTESLPNFEIASKSSQAVQLNTAPAGTKLTGVAGSYGISTSGSAYANSGPAGLVLSGSALTAGTKFGADNSTYQDNAPVQQRATQMYLYFYVGQYSQSATEQTAGLNAELFNGKADRDLQNVTSNLDFVVESYNNGTEWYKIYKSGWCEQGGLFKITATGDHKETINFLKTFANTNYQFFATGKTSSSDLNPGFIAICMVGPNCTTAKVEVKWYTSSYTTTTNDNINWRACGYIS